VLVKTNNPFLCRQEREFSWDVWLSLRLLSLAQTLATGNRPEKLRPSVVGRACPHSDTAATEPREAFGVRRIPALWMGSARRDAKAPEYGRTPNASRLRLPLCLFVQRHSENLRKNALW